MPSEAFRPIHRVVVEFITPRETEADEFDSAEGARQRVEAAKVLPGAWHIFYSVQKARTGRHFIQLSVYFCHDTRQWEPLHSEEIGITPPEA